MEDIISLIVFVIIITVSSIFSKLKAKQNKQPGAAPLAGGWVTKLKAFLIYIERQIEQRSTDRTPGASGWDQLLDGGETSSSTYDVDEDTVDDLMFEEEGTQPRLKRRPPSQPVRAHTSQSDRTQFVPDDHRRKALHAGKSSRTFMAASRADLRKAVIWSEILGPPMALRDEHSGKGGAS